ncbi:MAG: hypothetical protein JOY62_18425 [Acidobacteriaceae bacterium]|nr:hypothetical protein [Acidobacteriaceae bacterium]MBV9781943.1 hypothetical protein [Acidobacteriaceae bacterium]
MIVFCLFLSLGRNAASADSENQSAWQQILHDRLPAYGHRNWIVIADSAYPAQARDGIETIVSRADHFQVLEAVLSALSSAKHVRPIVFTDRELSYIPETDAHGITAYRSQLHTVLKNWNVQTLPHEQLISKLDATAQTFRVLIIKTNMTLPYTSVFLQLDCAYWTSEAEQKLRASMAKDER